MAMALTVRDKIGHLYRRFGLGMRPADLEDGMKLGVEGTLKKLIEYERQPDLPFAPEEFYWREKEEADLGAWRLRGYWSARLLATERPLQEKLAIFWHSHFAVSDSKVEDGPMMRDYLHALHENACGKFEDLLEAMSKSPAMMRYLDMQRSMRGTPNENFAREVMELFSLGIGNYSEEDVKEVSRALTGWGYINTYWELPGNTDQKLKDALRDQRPFSAFTYMPAMHDPDPKTILGKTKAWDGDSVLKLLALHPKTAERTCTRLWEYFVYANPEPHVINRLVGVWKSSGGDIKKVMYSIGRSKEFYSERAYRQLAKSPVDFCVPICRQMGVGTALLTKRDPKATRETAIPKEVLDNSSYLAYMMERQGLNLLYPPDVSGWRWGSAWLTPDAMAQRFQYRGLMIWSDKGPGAAAINSLAYVKGKNPQDPEQLCEAMVGLFDIEVGDESKKRILDICKAVEGPKCLADPPKFQWLLAETLRFAVASPGAHLA